MTYEFTKFYVTVCDELDLIPSEVDEALYVAISDCFEKGYTVESTVVELENDSQWETRITNIEELQTGDLVTITVPIYEYNESFYINLRGPIYDEVAKKQHPRVTFHGATRKGIHASA